MPNTFIYLLSCPYTGLPKYIGKANNPKKRLFSHLTDGRVNQRYTWLKSLISQNNLPSLDILDEVKMENWQFWEKYYISLYKSWGFHLLNNTEGGEGSSFHNLKTRRSFSGKKNPMFGKKRPEVGIKNKRYKGKSYKERYGTEKALVIKEKISKSVKKTKKLKPIIQLDLNGVLIKKWDSTSQVVRELKFNRSGISSCLTNKKEKSNNFKWAYNKQ